ncbi:MAG: EamA family transporter RarD, partial [Firmicutes bacterium]|nr:EamA family transporter RarD [Bacillota bacterium]
MPERIAGQQNRKMSGSEKRGVVTAFMCYLVWGLLPIFWKMIEEVSPYEIIAHRIIWCFVVVMLICLITRQDVASLYRDKRAWRFLAPAAAIITANWSVYIYAVSNYHVIETAIGYYINPLITILLGLIVFRERLSVMQWIAVGLCTAGVVSFTVNYGHFPWISIFLATTFGIYGAIKKKAGYPAIPAIAFENTLMVGPAAVFAVWLAYHTGTHAFASDLGSPHGIYLTVMLIIAGLLTALPLTLFSTAANLIQLSFLGFIQFFSPTLSLLTGVFLYGEPF